MVLFYFFMDHTAGFQWNKRQWAFADFLGNFILFYINSKSKTITIKQSFRYFSNLFFLFKSNFSSTHYLSRVKTTPICQYLACSRINLSFQSIEHSYFLSKCIKKHLLVILYCYLFQKDWPLKVSSKITIQKITDCKPVA